MALSQESPIAALRELGTKYNIEPNGNLSMLRSTAAWPTINPCIEKYLATQSSDFMGSQPVLILQCSWVAIQLVRNFRNAFSNVSLPACEFEMHLCLIDQH
jgi:hypothetical protein